MPNQDLNPSPSYLQSTMLPLHHLGFLISKKYFPTGLWWGEGGVAPPADLNFHGNFWLDSNSKGATATHQWKKFTTNKISMYVMFYVLPFHNIVNSTWLMEKIHWEDRFPDSFATVCAPSWILRMMPNNLRLSWNFIKDSLKCLKLDL